MRRFVPPAHARVGAALSTALLLVFAVLLVLTASDRNKIRPQLVAALSHRLVQRGVKLAPTPVTSVTCQPELTYHFSCRVLLASAGTGRFDLHYVDGGCWYATLMRSSPAGQGLPKAVQGCGFGPR